MSATQNMLPPGDSSGNSRLLPSIREAGTSLNSLLGTVKSIDQTMTSIVAKAQQFNQVFQNMRALGAGSNSPIGPTGGGTYWGSNSTYGSHGAASAPRALPSSQPQPSMAGSGQGGFPPGVAGPQGAQYGGQYGPMGTGSGGPGGGPGGFGSWVWNTGVVSVASGINKGIVGAASKAPAMYQDNLLYNRTSMMYNNGSLAGQQQAPYSFHNNMTLQGQAGYYSTADRNNAINTVRSVGVSNFGDAGYQQNMAGAALISGSSASAVAGISAGMAGVNPQTQLMARTHGIMMVDPKSGNQADISTFLNQVQRADGGAFKSKADVTASLGLNGPMRATLKQLGWSDADITNVAEPAYIAQQKTGKPIDLTSKAFRDQTGIQNSNINHATGRAAAQDLTNTLQSGGAANGLNAANRAAQALADSFNNLGSTIQGMIGYAKGVGAGSMGGGNAGGTSAAGGVLSTISHEATRLGEDALLLGGGKTLLPGLKGAASKVPGLGFLSKAATSGGGLGAKFKAWAPKAGIATLVGGAAGQLIGNIGNKNGHQNPTARMFGDTISDAATGAALGSFIGPEGTVIGGALGGVAGFIQGGGVGNFMKSFTGGLGFGSTANDSSSAGGASGGKGLNMGQLIGFAEQQLGTPYSWGGGGVGGPSTGIDQASHTKGFDCSSFVQYVFAHYGIMLPRTTYQQVKSGVAVNPDQAQAGDLLFFDGPASAPGHVGIYLGNNTMIEAPHTGANIRKRSVDPHSAVAIRRVASGGGSPLTGSAQGTGTAGSGGINPLAATSASLGRVSSRLGITANLGGGTGDPSMTTASSGGVAANGGSGGMGTYGNPLPKAVGNPPSQLSANQRLGQRMAAQRGWIGNEWNALFKLWQHESSWNSNALNASSGAYGIPQANPSGGQGHPYQMGDAPAQIKWGLDYIGGRYHNPENAWNHELKVGWYDKGSWRIKKDEMAVVHKDEMVLNKQDAGTLRSAISGGGGSGCKVDIHLTVASASDAEARRFAATTKALLEHDNHVTSIAST